MIRLQRMYPSGSRWSTCVEVVYAATCGNATQYQAFTVRHVFWSGRPLQNRVQVSTSCDSRRDAGSQPSNTGDPMVSNSLKFRETDRTNPTDYGRLRLQSGRPLGDSVWLSRACGRVSRTGTLRPHAPLERSTAQRQGWGVYLPRLVTRRQTCAVYGGTGKVLLRPNAGDH